MKNIIILRVLSITMFHLSDIIRNLPLKNLYLVGPKCEMKNSLFTREIFASSTIFILLLLVLEDYYLFNLY